MKLFVARFQVHRPTTTEELLTAPRGKEQDTDIIHATHRVRQPLLKDCRPGVRVEKKLRGGEGRLWHLFTCFDYPSTLTAPPALLCTPRVVGTVRKNDVVSHQGRETTESGFQIVNPM